MRGRDAGTGPASTVAAVTRLLPRVTPPAVLLTDDPGDAARLIAIALSAPHALDGPDGALLALARQAQRRSHWAAEQVIVSLPGGAPADEDTVLADAMRTLTDRARAAVVLDLIAGLPPGAAVRGRDRAVAAAETEAAVAGLREDLARRDDVERRERAEAAVRFRRPGSAPDPEAPTPDLRERLARLAAGRPLPAAAAETIAASVDSARRARRKRRRWLAAGVAAAALLAAVIPLLPRAPGTPLPVTVYGSPTTGSLAGDADFLRAVGEGPWAGDLGASERRRVVFAGDVPGGRWTLLAAGGSASRPAAAAWFTGPVGASPDRMTLRSVRLSPDPVTPVSLTDPDTGALVVVGAQGDRVRVSESPQIDAGGSITRRFRAVPTAHGLAVVALAPVPGAAVSGVRLEVVRDGHRLGTAPPTVVTTAPALDPPITGLRPAAPPAVGDAAVQPRLRTLLGQLGEPAARTAVTVLWSGDLPGPNDQPARLTVVAIPQPSGALVVTAPYGYAADPSGRPGSSWCGTGVLPGGIPLEQRVVAVQCDLSDLTVEREISRFLVVVGPRTATSVRLVDATGAVLREEPLDDGVAVVRSPGAVAQVSVTTADGGTAAAIPLVEEDLGG